MWRLKQTSAVVKWRLSDWTLLRQRVMEDKREDRRRGVEGALTWSIVGGGSYRRDGRSTRGRIRSLSVSLYRGGGADKMVLRIAILKKKRRRKGKKEARWKEERRRDDRWDHRNNLHASQWCCHYTISSLLHSVNTTIEHSMQTLPFCRGCGDLCIATCCSGLEMLPSLL